MKNKFELSVLVLLGMIVILLFFVMLDSYDTAGKLAEIMNFLNEVVIVDVDM